MLQWPAAGGAQARPRGRVLGPSAGVPIAHPLLGRVAAGLAARGGSITSGASAVALCVLSSAPIGG